ncbi:MAG: AAA family ATPase, partial [Acidimicrobiales bacterium]
MDDFADHRLQALCRPVEPPSARKALRSAFCLLMYRRIVWRTVSVLYDRGVLLRRAIEARYRETVASRRVTVVTGPRQSGKTTLVSNQLAGGSLRSLDDQGMLDAARTDPTGFVSTGARPLVIDEVQRGGEPLVRAIKAAVDRDPAPGQFVLTGSSNFLTVPTISESLAGRAAFLEVWPFTQGELAGRNDSFVDAVIAGAESLAGYR